MLIGQPRNPRVSDETRGPNSPDTVDPGFNNPYRNPKGDVGGPGRVTGRETEREPFVMPMPTEGPK